MHAGFGRLGLVLVVLVAVGCGRLLRSEAPAAVEASAESYVRLVLALGEHDPSYVDAYYGPPEWRAVERAERRPLAAIETEASRLIAQLDAPEDEEAELPRLRRVYLRRQLQALAAHARRLGGQRYSFTEEARLLYDVTPPRFDEPEYARRRAKVAELLPPGKGRLSDRYNAYVNRFAIPPERLESVMQAAIEAARRRTLQFIDLPRGESFELRLVRDKPWSAYNWYQGRYRSIIEINTDLPVTATRVVDLAVHEGYPGHHVYNALLEHELVRKRGWPEFQVYPLHSPQSLIAEGTADYAVQLAFPQDERLALLRDVIFPAAGLDPREARRFLAVTEAAEALGPATVEAARRYRDGASSAAETVRFLQHYALASPARARQRIAFFDALGAYIVNYSLGEALVAAYVDGRADNEAERWKVFRALLASPRLPSGLRDTQLDGGADSSVRSIAARAMG